MKTKKKRSCLDRTNYPDAVQAQHIEALATMGAAPPFDKYALAARIELAQLDGQSLRLTAAQQRIVFGAALFGKRQLRFDAMNQGQIFVLEGSWEGTFTSYQEQPQSLEAVSLLAKRALEEGRRKKLPAIGKTFEIVSLDDIEHEGRKESELLGKKVQVLRHYVPSGICLSPEDPLIICRVQKSGEVLAFYKENLK
jgi:hypothetical protein